MSVLNNLAARFRLLRTALGKRYIYDDLVRLVREHGQSIDDIEGNLEPFSVMERLLRRPVSDFPDFASRIPSTLIKERDYSVGWSSEPSVSLFLGRLVVAIRAETIIEIGCFLGWTTAHFAVALDFLGAEGGQIHYVDCEPRFLDQTSANLEILGLLPRGRRHQGVSHDPGLLEQLPAKADLIFIDSSHLYEDTCLELEAYAQRVSPGGCLALHDSIKTPGVRQAIQEKRHSFHVHTFATERGNGLSLLFPRDS
jgi:predicted O-methyltransferase YrrM